MINSPFISCSCDLGKHTECSYPSFCDCQCHELVPLTLAEEEALIAKINEVLNQPLNCQEVVDPNTGQLVYVGVNEQGQLEELGVY